VFLYVYKDSPRRQQGVHATSSNTVWRQVVSFLLRKQRVPRPCSGSDKESCHISSAVKKGRKGSHMLTSSISTNTQRNPGKGDGRENRSMARTKVRSQEWKTSCRYLGCLQWWSKLSGKLWLLPHLRVVYYITCNTMYV
jgi:hypothetical protein